jgi:DHA1 family tetracycline resistance protein-like MFS transporter
MNKIKLTILLTVFIDVLGIGIVIPVLPFYVQSFGMGPFMITLLFVVFSLFSFFSSPFLGALSDRIGRRPILIVSIASSAIGWLVFAGARNITMLFAGRIIDGFAAGNITTAQSYLIDISENDKERTANLGLIGMIFGLGFILGPLLGGFLAQISHAFPFWFVGFLSLANVIFAYMFLPETNINRTSGKKLNLNPLSPIMRAVRNRVLRPSYSVWFLFMMAVALAQAIFSLYLNARFGFEEFTSGLVMAGIGLVVAFNQGFAMRRVWLRYFKKHHLGIWFLLLGAVGYLFYAIGGLYLFIVGLILSAFAQSILRAVLTSQAVGLANPNEQGEVLGILSSIASIGMIFGPLLGGIAFEKFINLPIYITVLLLFFAFALALFNHRRLDRSALPDVLSANSL